ncbi:hypothetical protein [Hyalangium rubrum]|uniref:Uncharacterized protein n=1 Tax=Hyalangium rubrum TaxID=3103134 RepID=A0ABU5H4X5_9BACT|nr:hypothetical protein [Hyalangium sp. s54d21]MDY7228129.1 hypothetical protein [Hyalangium sp. s54d21]
MATLKAEVRNGRLVLDVPTELPEGTALELVAADLGDELSEEERSALHEALSESWDEARAGKRVAAEEVLAKLRSMK